MFDAFLQLMIATMMKTIEQLQSSAKVRSAQLSTKLGPPRCRGRSRQMFDAFLSCN